MEILDCMPSFRIYLNLHWDATSLIESRYLVGHSFEPRLNRLMCSLMPDVNAAIVSGSGD
jgi:hypothetical protein